MTFQRKLTNFFVILNKFKKLVKALALSEVPRIFFYKIGTIPHTVNKSNPGT